MRKLCNEAAVDAASFFGSLVNRRQFLYWCAGVLTTHLAACGRTVDAPVVDPKNQALPLTLPIAEIVAQAKKEGKLRAYGMPPGWANWEGCFNLIESRYGIKSTYKPEGNLSGAEGVQKLISEVNNPIADIADVGIFGPEAKAKGATAAYKNSRWAEIPAHLKDADGHWASPYGGVISFGVNLAKVKTVPRTWKDLVSGDYPNMVALNGDPRQFSSALMAVVSAAYANGGSIDQVEKGIQLFAQIKRAGNFTAARADSSGVTSGEVGVAIKPDFANLRDREKLGSQTIEVLIPSDGSVAINFANVINRLAPNPYSARLFQEFIYSDEGQLEMLKAYVRPTLIDRLQVPADLQAKLPSREQYKAVIPAITDPGKLDLAKKVVQENWGPMVLGQG